MLDQYRSTLSTLSDEYPLIGAALTRHQNLRGEPLTFRNNPSLVEMYADLPVIGDVVIMAAVQTGKSELVLQHAFNRAGWHGEICTYVLPTTGIRNRFVQNRVDNLLREVDIYKAKTPKADDVEGVDNLNSKRFGAGALLFLSAKTPTDWVEFSTDLLIIDEYDNCEQTHLAKARDRLSASKNPQLIRIGNPLMPGKGISELYEETDQRRFSYQCECGHWQPIDWLQNVVMEDEKTGDWLPRDTENHQRILNGEAVDIRPVCASCSRPFARTVPGKWIPQKPRRKKLRGYWMSQLDILSKPFWGFFLEWVKAQVSPDLLSRFWTSVLGRAYEATGLRVTVTDLERAAIEPACQTQPNTEKLREVPVVAGIDVGSVLNVTISELQTHDDDKQARRGRWVGACRTFVELQDAMLRYAVDVAVIDAMPETRKASEFREWAKENGIRVFLCRFNPSPRTGPEWCGIKIKEVEQEVSVNRTGLLDETLAELRGGLRTLPCDYALVLGFAQQMMAPSRQLSSRGDRYIWDEGSKADHYRLADGYERVAAELYRHGGGTVEIDLSSAFNPETPGRRRRRRR